jgi:hypothetical protein
MTTIFRVRGGLLHLVRDDLERLHRFAGERVGFFLCRAGRLSEDGLVILAAAYYPVEDDDYLPDNTVGAMMGPAAIRKGMQRAYAAGAGDISLFHVHMHGHDGLPGFSRVDLDESKKFVPDFFNVAPLVPHGIVVLSRDRAIGLCWRGQGQEPALIDRFTEVAAPMNMWRGRI